MKITKQTAYRHTVAQRAMRMEEIVAWVKDERTRDKLALFREKLRRAYPDKRYPFTRKLPQLLFAGTFRKGELKEYNGWILLEINRLKSIEEALSLKQKIVEYPQTLFAMIGSSGRSVKFVVAYTYPDGSLPRSRTDAEVFHAHAYRHALKTYEPRLSYPIELKRPVLEMGCRLSYDADVYYNPDALSIHLEAKTAYLCKVLAAGGAEMYITGSNPLSTQDDVAAALVADGLNVYAWYDCTPEEYDQHITSVLENNCNIIIDDGGDLVHMLHTKMQDKLQYVIGGCEETTTGIIRLIAMAKNDELKFPMVLVNNADCKHLFDNRYGTGQSVFDGINRTTNLIVAGKYVVVAGYGWCGKGVAMRAKGLGAKVIVTEVDPIKAIEAVMDGFDVMPMNEAAKIGDFFITVTGCAGVISEDDFKVMKNGAILCNAGHFDVEIDMKRLREIALDTIDQRKNIVGYQISEDKWIYVLAEGRLVNLAAGDGHPAEIMDMSFAIQALSAKYLVENANNLTEKLISVPRNVDLEVANRKLRFLGKSIDTLTPEQEKYLNSSNIDL